MGKLPKRIVDNESSRVQAHDPRQPLQVLAQERDANTCWPSTLIDATNYPILRSPNRERMRRVGYQNVDSPVGYQTLVYYCFHPT